MDFSQPAILGKTGLSVGRLGFGASYGAPSSAFEEGFERGCNYFYWAARRSGMRDAIRNICSTGKRDKLVIAVQSYHRSAFLMERSLNKALKSLSIDHADIFILGWHNKPPSGRLLERARDMKRRGMFRFLGLSGHNRMLFPELEHQGEFDVFHVRYNAAHRGAETEVFPFVRETGLVNYTATRWGNLLNPKFMPPGESAPSITDCYRFVLSHPAVHVCLSGPKNSAQMKSALHTLDLGPMDNEELTRMRRIGDAVHKKRPFFL